MARLRKLLVTLGASLLITTCAARPPHPSLGPCAGANAHPDGPIVCVDDSSDVLRVFPDSVKLHDVVSNAKHLSPGIVWFTKSGRGDLEIRFKDETCVRDMKCRGSHCTAAAARLDSVQEQKACKYEVFVTGHKPLDPEVVIVRCCISSDLEPPGR